MRGSVVGRPVRARALPKLFVKTEIYLPTTWGWLGIVLVVGVLVFMYLRSIHGFLAINKPVTADTLVIEGWMRDYALKQALDEFNAGHYNYLVVTGGPLDRGTELSEYSTFAELTERTLLAMGADKNRLVVLPSPKTVRDRTYVTCLEVQEWLRGKPEIKALNVMTVGVHARRSRYIFRKVLGRDMDIGILSATYQDYDASKWWQSSIGLRTVISEQIAYIYFRFFWFI